MSMNRSAKTTVAIILAAALLLTGIGAALALSKARGGGQTQTSATATGAATQENPLAREPSAELEPGDLTQQERLHQLSTGGRLTDPAFKTVVNLQIANAPGKPTTTEPLAQPAAPRLAAAAAETDATLAANPAIPANPSSPEPVVSLSLYQPSIQEVASALARQIDFTAMEAPAVSRSLIVPTPTIKPTPTPPVSNATFTFQAPASGQKLIAGQSFTLSWTISNAMAFKYTIRLSTNGGASYQKIAEDVRFALDSTSTPRTYTMKMPSSTSSNCKFLVEAYMETYRYAWGYSPTFTIQSAAAPTPTVTPKPSPAPATPTPAPTAAPQPTPSVRPLARPETRYTRSSSVFVNRTEDPVRWMSLDVQTPNASKIVWQVSKSPFIGFSTAEALSPAGLLASGTLEPSQREFAVDFGAIVSQSEQFKSTIPNEQVNDGSPFERAARSILLNQDTYSLYVRAIAIDRSGIVIGDPGIGAQVSFGVPEIGREAITLPGSFTGKVEVWVADNASQYSGSYSHKPVEGFLAHPSDKSWYMEYRYLPEGIIGATMQITTLPFEKGVIENPAGLVKSVEFAKGQYSGYPLKTSVPIAEFAPPAGSLGTKTIRYYIRTVLYRQSATDPSQLEPVIPEIQTMYYNDLEWMDDLSLASASFVPTEVVPVKSYIPMTTFLRYVPVQWEDPNWKEYFEVTRPIKAQEMCFKITKGGETLLPYSYYKFSGSGLWIYNLEHADMPLAEYQARIDTWLSVGSSFHMTIKDSSSIWTEMASLAKSIYTSVQQAYDDLKSTIVSTIINFLPVDGDIKAVLKAALDTALNAGLAALGIPPSLPDFSALAAGGLDYCLEQAILEQCGIQNVVPEKITDEVRSLLKAEVAKKLDDLAKAANQNPLNVDFLKPASTRIYRPAYVEVSVHNYARKASPSGTLKINYGISGGWLLSFYKPVSVYVPPLQPDQFMILKVFLKENIDVPYSTYKPEFEHYYFGKSTYTCTFQMSVKYDVPDVMEAAKAQGLTSQSSPFPMLKREYAFDHNPVYAYSYQGLPCDFQLEHDKSVSFSEFYEK